MYAPVAVGILKAGDGLSGSQLHPPGLERTLHWLYWLLYLNDSAVLCVPVGAYCIFIHACVIEEGEATCAQMRQQSLPEMLLIAGWVISHLLQGLTACTAFCTLPRQTAASCLLSCTVHPVSAFHLAIMRGGGMQTTCKQRM